MADQRLEEYRAYYDARAERYANNPNMKHRYEAEKKLANLMHQYDSIEEIGQHLGHLNTDCAFAEWRDQYEMESKYYENVEEPIRKKGADDILSELDKTSDITDMMTKITDLTNKNNVEISLDEGSGNALLDQWMMMDGIEIYENAVVPLNYKSRMQEKVQKLKKNILEYVEYEEKKLGEWQNGWKIKPEIALEPRFRYKNPYSDEDIAKRLEEFKKLINR